ncbi:MAG: glycoside hydrolase family 127 protein [Tannerellaceae bacterium]|jgi:DUF1680 family protein|nr:glycoside hydrolase family 127 protein [Tannerellaceae bacterium]
MKNKIIYTLFATAGVVFGGLACERCGEILVKNQIPLNVTYAGLDEVRLLDSPFKHAMELNARWMLELEPDRLLADFRKNAGLVPKAESYGGWENSGIAGHTLGHYLTAASQQYAATGDARFKERIDYIVAELDSCQMYFVNGFIGGMPGGDKVFKEVKKGIIRSKGFDLNGVWSPWYNLHKTMTGLNAAYLLTGNETARKVLIYFADYLQDVVAGLSDEQVQTMLECEYGGMNEAFAQVYALSGDKKYLDASYIFYHKKLQDKLAEGVDALQGLHSNTQIPKLIGSALQYQLTGNERDRKIADFSWNTLVEHHSYANGGNSMGEYLSVPDKLSDRLGTNTCETCNTYNMLKLTQYLYQWTNHPRYLDYYERALYNHILASQHSGDGRTCYFVSLGMGTKKNFYGKDNNFTCCMGSGFENHSKYGEAIYAYGNDQQSVFVNLFIPSVLTWKQKGIVLKMETAYPENGRIRLLLAECPQGEEANICLRYPSWSTAGVTVKVNGARQKISASPGSFISIRRKWKKGDRLEMLLPVPIYTVSMPDNADRRAVFYGPTLLAGVFGTEERLQGDIPVFVSEEKSITNYIKPLAAQPLTFTASLPGPSGEAVAMIPFYKVTDQYQTVYWDVYSPEEWEATEAKRKAEVERLAALDKRTLDYIVLGEMQPERDHGLDGENTRTGEGYLRKYRMAYEGGWFAFDMKCNYADPVRLILTYYGGDSKKYSFEVEVDKRWTTTVNLTQTQDGFVEFPLDIPREVTSGKESLRVTFRAGADTRVSNIYHCRLIKK